MHRRTFHSLALGSLAHQLLRAAPLPLPAKDFAGDPFPDSFAWGAATSALQVEGVPYADGGGHSIWSTLDRHPELVKDGSNDLVADLSYRLYREDITLLKRIGLNSYRFSIGWSRVMPQGTGKPNAKALGYYDRLVDDLLAAGITPWATIYHFDYPQELERRGGWLHASSSHWLAEYADLLGRTFGDRIRRWMTINEPNITWSFGWEAGAAPPYRKLSRDELATGAHNLLLGHGRAVAALRAAAKQAVEVSLPIAGQISMPATASEADIECARQQSFTMAPHPMGPKIPALTTINMALWLDPIYLGRYSEQTLRVLPKLVSLASASDLETIHQPLDFCAANLYFANRVRAGEHGQPEFVANPPETRLTAYGWPITPEILYWGPRLLYERYRKPIVVTENGMSRHDHPGADGKIHDTERCQFLKDYLRQLSRARHSGVPIDGYFHWSLLDNWEFDQGFTQQFGLVYVDRQTLQRIPKDSAETYAQIVKTKGSDLS